MPVYRFRVTFEDHEDLVRDIEIKPAQTLEDLHKAILSSVRFDTDRETVFFTCNDYWRKEDTYVPTTYKDKKLVQLVEDPHQKLLFEFDTDRPWTLYLELFRIVPDEPGVEYPRCVKEVGMAPPQFRLKPTDPELLEEDEDEISQTEKHDNARYYRDPDDFDDSSVDEGETPEGEEDTGDSDSESGSDSEEEFNFNDSEENIGPGAREEEEF